MKKYKFTIILSTIVTLLPIIVGLILWDRLPDRVATHFSFDNQANGWSSKAFAVFGLPLILTCCHYLALFKTFRQPQPSYKNLHPKMIGLLFWLCPAVSLFTSFSIYANALEHGFNGSTFVVIFLGVIIIAIGNLLPKCRQNFAIGIRIPWTLSDPENWVYTHRIGGYCMTIGGVAVIISAFFDIPWLSLFIILASVLVPIPFSYLYYKKHKGDAPDERN